MMRNNLQKWRNTLFGRESWANQMYGNDFILRTYVKTRLPYRIPGELQHGWQFDAGLYGDLSKHGEKEKARRHFVWNERNLERCIEYGYKNVTAIGAPFLYLPPAASSDIKFLGSKSLLLFPIHSTESENFIDPLVTYKSYIQEIEDLLSVFQPVTVCLYWVQYENEEIVKLFKDKGINVVTLGHRDNNPSFLINFRNLTVKHSYVSSDIYASAVFYSLYMRKKVFIFGKPRFSEMNLFQYPGRKDYDHSEFSDLYPQLLWQNFNDESHYWIGEKELGLEFRRTPRELREIFGWKPMKLAKESLYGLNKHRLLRLKQKARIKIGKKG